MGSLRIEGKSLRTADFEAFSGKEGGIAGKRDRVARHVNQAVYRRRGYGVKRLFREAGTRRVHDERRGDIHHVVREPFLGPQTN